MGSTIVGGDNQKPAFAAFSMTDLVAQEHWTSSTSISKATLHNLRATFSPMAALRAPGGPDDNHMRPWM
jgi:hypothetical protein